MALVVFGIIAVQSRPVKAQWTTSGNNISNTNTGNVGIGTTSPSSGRLQVNKSIRIDDDSGSSTGSDTLLASPNLYLGTSTGGSAFQFNSSGGLDLWQYNAAAWGRTVTFAKNGSVGIGTTAPNYSLDVQANTQWVARFKKTDATHGGIIVDAAAGYNPNLALSVNGAIKWYVNSNSANGDALQFWESAGSFPRFTLTQAGNVGIGTATPNKSSVSKALTVNGSTDAIFELAIGDTRKGNMYHDGTNLSVYNNANGALTLGTNNNERLRIEASGNVGIGTTSPTKKLDVAGDLNASGTITGGNIAAKYQDVAEWVESSQTLAAGTVVVLDQTKSNQVIASSQSYDTRVAGVISLQPGITLGEKGAGKVLVATTGRVRIKVDASRGPIQVGDLLVTSDVQGVAMKSQPINVGGIQIHRPGTLVGKAIESLDKGTGEILVLLSLQ